MSESKALVPCSRKVGVEIIHDSFNPLASPESWKFTADNEIIKGGKLGRIQKVWEKAQQEHYGYIVVFSDTETICFDSFTLFKLFLKRAKLSTPPFLAVSTKEPLLKQLSFTRYDGKDWTDMQPYSAVPGVQL